MFDADRDPPVRRQDIQVKLFLKIASVIFLTRLKSDLFDEQIPQMVVENSG